MNRGPEGTRRATPAWVDWDAERSREYMRKHWREARRPNWVASIWIIAAGVTLGILAGGLATDVMLANGWWPIAMAF